MKKCDLLAKQYSNTYSYTMASLKTYFYRTTAVSTIVCGKFQIFNIKKSKFTTCTTSLPYKHKYFMLKLKFQTRICRLCPAIRCFACYSELERGQKLILRTNTYQTISNSMGWLMMLLAAKYLCVESSSRFFNQMSIIFESHYLIKMLELASICGYPTVLLEIIKGFMNNILIFGLYFNLICLLSREDN